MIRRRSRQGLTIIEMMVTIAILIALVVVAIPAVSSLLELNQRKAAKDLVLLYQQLHDEAVLQNVTFRVVYFPNEGTYEVEIGEPGALIFNNAEDREEYEERLERKLKAMDDDEMAAYKASRKPFEKLSDRFGKKFELPTGVAFGGVYTPQYEEMVVPTFEDELVDEEAGEDHRLRVHSYIFASGFTEHTVVWLVDVDNPEDGYTIEVEPLSGEIHLTGELVEWEDGYDFVPDEGPSLPS
jgi:type II secretory pathway pseudopilin PulG